MTFLYTYQNGILFFYYCSFKEGHVVSLHLTITKNFLYYISIWEHQTCIRWLSVALLHAVRCKSLFSNKLKDQLGHVKDSLAYVYLQLQ